MSMVHIVICLTVIGGLISCLLVVLNTSIILMPYRNKNPEKDWKIKATQDTASWASKSNFDFLSFYNVQCNTRWLFMAAWESKEKPTYLCQYIFGPRAEVGIVWDIITIFENQIYLTTSNTKDANLRPKPSGHYSQSFSKCSFDELYKKHRESEEYLTTKGGAKVEKSPIGFEESFVNSIKITNRYHRRHWYWIIFLFYYYFVRRKRWYNKTIQKQYELGMIKLPNEIFLK